MFLALKLNFDFKMIEFYRQLFNMVLKWLMAGEPGSTTRRRMKRLNWTENGKRFKTLFKKEKDPPHPKNLLNHPSRCLDIRDHFSLIIAEL